MNTSAMKTLTKEGKAKLEEIATRYGLSYATVETMLQAIVQGHGTMAQFNIPELGGQGQWMKGGMTMVGNMFNYSLQSTVSSLCAELSNLIEYPSVFEDISPTSSPFVSGNWWPSEYGIPNASGAQNHFKYAYFGHPVNRLVLEVDGKQTIYDTHEHHINSVSQQQGITNKYAFTSQYGVVDVDQLKVVEYGTAHEDPLATLIEQVEEAAHSKSKVSETIEIKSDDIFETIERLAQLKQKGYITDEEFASKKTELLKRL